jgi:hypothetical protein
MRICWAVLLMLAVVAPARGQEAEAALEPASQPTPLERLGVTGAVRVGYWSSTRDLDGEQPLGATMLWLKTSRRVSSHVSFLAEGWAALRGPLEDGKATGELREAFVDLRMGRLDIRAGRQILAWGRADGVNPTDNLSGQDLRLLVPDDADRRLGATAVRASYYVRDVSFTGVWLPEFRGHEFALPAPPPGVAFVREGTRWPGHQWAMRVEQTGRAVDWSVSYFRGRDMAPDLEARPPHIRLSHHGVQVLGGDMAATVGRFGLRAEGAYVHTDDPHGRDPFTKNPFVFLVAGVDRTVGGLLNLNVQYLYRHVRHQRETSVSVQDVLNSQTRAVQHGASFRLAYKWLHETLEAEGAAVAFAEPSGVAFRPKVVYALTDSWKALAGAEILRGEAASPFGFLERNSTAYAELRWSF